MNSTKYRKMTRNQLQEALSKAQDEISSTRFDVRVGQEKDYGQIVWKKKEVARMQTVLNEKSFEKGKSEEKNSKSVKKEKEELAKNNNTKKQINKS